MTTPFVMPSVLATDAAFAKELLRRTADPREAVFDPVVPADQRADPAVHANALNQYSEGVRSLTALGAEIVQRGLGASESRVVAILASLVAANGIESETDLAFLMQAGYLAFARAAAPTGHPDPVAFAPAAALWRAFVGIIVMRDGEGNCTHAAGVGILDKDAPLRAARLGEFEELEIEMDVPAEQDGSRSMGMLTPGAVGGGQTLSGSGSASKEGKSEPNKSSSGEVRVIDLDGREVWSGLKGLVTRIGQLGGLRRLADQARLDEFQGVTVEFKPEHILQLITMYGARIATFSADAVPAHWRSTTLLQGLQGARFLSSKEKFSRFLEVSFSPLDFSELSLSDFGPASTPAAGCGNPDVVTSEFKDALLVSAQRFELALICFFGAGFEGVMQPLCNVLRARSGLLYTMPDVILNYHIQGVLAAFSYSVRFEKASDGEPWFGDGRMSTRLTKTVNEWLESVRDMSFSTVASFRIHVLPTLKFGGKRVADGTDDGGAPSRKKKKGKKGPTTGTPQAGAQAQKTQGQGSGGAGGGGGGGARPLPQQARAGAGAGGVKPYCVFRLAELYGIANLQGNTITCRHGPGCVKLHPASVSAVDKVLGKKAVEAASGMGFAAELLKKF